MLIFKYSATPFLLFSLFRLLSFSSEAAPIYSAHVCTDVTVFQPKSTFQSNLNVLLSSLTSNASLPDGFYRTTVAGVTPDAVTGLIQCRGDVNATVCRECVAAAAKDIIHRCPNQTESIIWYDVCMLRYSNTSLNPLVPGFNKKDDTNIAAANLDLFNRLLANLLDGLAATAAGSQSEKKFATDEVNLTSSQTLYGLAQCVNDITDACYGCLKSAIANFPLCCNGSEGARVLFPGCTIRYAMKPFYNITSKSAKPLVPSPSSSGKSSVSIIAAIVVSVAVLLGLFILGCRLQRKRRKNYDTVLQDSLRYDITLADSLQFDLATIETATNRFSDDKKIGQGGFGVVYKGTLYNGQEIAVKRLSRSSLQGAIEFKTEVALVAQLQHKNLVRLLGFCLEGQEKILIYEYIPNKSLDHFLFEPERQGLLNWSTRYKIIAEIARGMHYLHEDSRLKIIHRDLKASNILLDANMNPKISDFGLAKIFHANETQEKTSTGRIVGTLGYMSPEYAMFGKFSAKSDVFSFGVLILEIVNGKKNSNFYLSNQKDDLSSFAWKNWTNRTPLELLDSTLRGSYTKTEVIRCIHIALLCLQENPSDRPSMASIALMLNSHSVTLPLPRQPASFLRGGRTPSGFRNELDFDQSCSRTIPFSMNDASVTGIHPR